MHNFFRAVFGGKGSVTINGQTFSGSSVVISSGNVVVVDGQVMPGALVPPIMVTVNGDVELIDGLIALMDTLQDTLEVPKEAIVTEAMNKAGNDIATELVAASIAKSMNGLGGSLTYEEWLNKEVANHDLCIAYSKSEIDSVTAIYLAMVRAKAL